MKVQSDVQSEKSTRFTQLDWVGMSQIQTALRFESEDEISFYIPALLDLGVDLTENHRGIHMSRLYQLHQDFILNQILTNQTLSQFGQKCLDSHKGLSQNFACKLKFSWPMKTISLKSHLTGFRNYNLEIIFEKCSEGEDLWMQFEVFYSSTCPQSESLSMEILKKQTQIFDHLPATPHAQRSRAIVQVHMNEMNQDIIGLLIQQVEQALGTPVQTTVKKEDEMRFAELNAENLMFCEDAARKITQALTDNNLVKGFSVCCEHQESLHPHNATSLSLKKFKRPRALHFN